MDSLLPGDAGRSLANAAKGLVDKARDALHGDDRPPLQPVESVDVERYAGLWYELARLPMTFQSDGTVSTAKYTAQPGGTIKVVNRALRGDEVDAEITGTATPAEGAEDTANRLIVKFGGLLKWLPVDDQGNYWIIGLEDDYSMALVATPDRRSLWLLSRNKDAWDTPTAQAYMDLARAQGFETAEMLIANWEDRVTR